MYVINWLLVDTNILVVGGHQQSKYVVAFDPTTKVCFCLYVFAPGQVQSASKLQLHVEGLEMLTGGVSGC